MDRKSRQRSEDSEAELPSTSADSHQRALYAEKIRESSEAIQKGDFQRAVRLYTEALALTPHSYILYSNRSATYIKLGQPDKALKDARKAKELNPKWPKGYYREGVALQCLGRVADALASYAAGLVQDPSNTQLLQTLQQTCLQSALKERFQPLFAHLQKMKLEQSPFVIVSVIGQELLAAGYSAASVTVLESALRIGSCSIKLRGSVFSALSSAHWALGNIDKAIACMQQDLAIAKSLADQEGECRAHGNLGAAYFSKGNYREALQHHRFQLVLAMRLKQTKTASAALSSLGHVYTAIRDYPNALASHKQCAFLVKQTKDKLQEAKEIGNMGAVFLAMGNFDKALECHSEHLKIAKSLNNRVEEARAYSNIGSAYHYKRDYKSAITYHKMVLTIATELHDKTLEARAYAGLGHAARCMQDYIKAKEYHEKQLDNALQTKDKVAEGRACSNLGIIYHQLGEYDAALKLHKAHLQIAKNLGDRASQGRAYGNIGNAHSALQQYDLAIRFHKQELAISKEVCDRHSEAATHGNLAVAYQSLQMYEKAIHHYLAHLNLARELKDAWSEARALSNLGNYYSSRKDYQEAIPVYEQYLAVTQELHDVEGEGRACHKLGYVHYCLGNYKEAVHYYEQDLSLARDQQDKTSMCHAYCNLGLAYKALGEYQKALECQQNFLSTADTTKNTNAKFLALGNIGDVLAKMDKNDEAVKMFNQQLTLARQLKNRKLEALAFSNLGSIHKKLQQFDKALGYHNQELTIYQEINDIKGECKAHGSLGNIHVCLRKYISACHCYEEQLDRSRDLRDINLEARAYGNLGITKMNMSHTSDAIGYFESQLALLEQASGRQALMDRGHAYCNLGNCYESIGDYEEAIKYYEQYLAVAQSTASISDQESAYRYLGNTHRSMGNLQQALVCFEKRLVIAHELDKPEATSSAYGELGCLHSMLGNYEQAISCLQHQLQIAKEIGDRLGEGEAACGLGGVYQQMGEYEKALEHHNIDLDIAVELNNTSCQCRAYGNLGLTQESLGNLEEALRLQQKHLAIATKTNDKTAKTLAYSSLGRIYHAQGDYQQAVQYLQQGLQVADQIQHAEDEAKIRHRLGLALWGLGDLEGAQTQLYAAIDLFESMRREAQFNSEYKLSLFDLQTASYQALQRVLVGLGHHDDALVVAERGRTRAFVDLLLERQSLGADTWYSSLDSSPVTKEIILDTVTKQRAAVLYFSVAVGYLYSWLILPEKGIVKFHESAMNESDIGSDPEDTQSLKSFRSFSMSTASLLDNYVGQARESLGVESHLSSSRLSLNHMSSHLSETESDADDLWQQHLEEIGEKLNNERDHTGFLRMEKRNHVWNASSYSLSSLLSFSSGVFSNRNSSIRSKTSNMSASSLASKPALSALYELLLKPMEASLPPTAGHEGCKELILVLQGDLYLVPFALLKPCQTAAPLCERYNLLAVPSIRALQASQALSGHIKYNPDCTGAVVIGNPKLHQSVIHTWQWSPIPATEHECRMVSEMMGCRSLTGTSATKENILREIPNAELIHFATHISWKLAAIVVSPSNFSTTSAVHGNLERMDLSDSSSDIVSLDGPSLSDIIITAADVLNTRMNAKLVVLSSGYSDDRAGRINTDGVVGLTRAFLAAGAQCILFSLWPVPDMASRMLMKTFYTAMLQGAKASQALSTAMKSLQNSRQFSHPSNWASWLLIGSDVVLSSKVALMGHALCELLKTPEKSREAMRVVLHLVEKSLQRIHHGQRKAMYTTQASIANRVGDVSGWRDLLTSVGFRLEPSTNDLPAAVFFPTFDPGDRLTQCSASLQALLGLPLQTLTALSKMVEHGEVGEMVMTLIRDASSKIGDGGSFQVPVNVRLWRAPGVHEFLASLGFDLVEVGKDEVTLRVNRQANRRSLQFGLQSLVAVFDTQDAPRTLLLDSSSSMESLCSSSSATSTSNFSKGSTPPTSPQHKRKSFFNPSEVEKLPSAKIRQSPGVMSVSPHTGSTKDINIHLQHQNIIREKYSSPSGSDLSDVNLTDTSHARVLSVDTGDGSCPEDLVSGHTSKRSDGSRSHRSSGVNRSRSKYERNSKGYLYSTSASDSEDNFVPESNLSRAKSRSSQSVASQSSTLTIRSTGSSGFRRNRSRMSSASIKSSASDRTLTCDSQHGSQETLVGVDAKLDQSIPSGLLDKNVDNLSDSGIHSKHTDTATDNSADNDSHDCHQATQLPNKRNEVHMLHEEYHLCDNLSEPAGSGKAKHCNETTLKQSPLSDPTSIAHKVLAETGKQRAELEAMQRWSVQNLKQRIKTELNGTTSADSITAKPASSLPSLSAEKSPQQPRQSTPKQSEPNKKSIPSEPNRPAPTLNKPLVDAKHISVSQFPSTGQQGLGAEQKVIMANSLRDSMVSYTCRPGERVNYGSATGDVSFSQSELESENELSVIEEESEGVSDINSSFSHSEIADRLRGLQVPNSVPSNVGSHSASQNGIPWYEEGSLSPAKDTGASSNSHSSTPPTPKSTKTVTFQDEVEMEILSQCSEMLDAGECGILETDLDQGQDLGSREYEEMNVDGDLVPDKDGHDDNLPAPTSPAPQEVTSNGPSEKGPVQRQVMEDGGGSRSLDMESAINHKPPVIPPPPIGYKPPPPYPGPRRQGFQHSSNSSHSATVVSTPGHYPSGGTDLPKTSTRYTGQNTRWHGPSLSPVDGPDVNSPQNLFRMSKQFYNGSVGGTNPALGSLRLTQKGIQNVPDQCKSAASTAHGWAKERSYDGSGTLRSVSYPGHCDPPVRRPASYSGEPRSGQHQYSHSDQSKMSSNPLTSQSYQNPCRQRAYGNDSTYPDQHPPPHPGRAGSNTEASHHVQNPPHPNQDRVAPNPAGPRRGPAYKGQTCLQQNFPNLANGYHNKQSGFVRPEPGQCPNKEWYHSDTDSVSSYRDVNPAHQPPVGSQLASKHGGYASSASQHNGQSNGFSSPNSLSSHDSYAEMRSIFPGARSPQNSGIPLNAEEGTVRYGDTLLHASKC